MSSLVIVVLAALSLVDAGDVLTLTDADFDSRLADFDLTLVKFYAPWYVKCAADFTEYMTGFWMFVIFAKATKYSDIDAVMESGHFFDTNICQDSCQDTR